MYSNVTYFEDMNKNHLINTSIYLLLDAQENLIVLSYFTIITSLCGRLGGDLLHINQ